MGKVGVLFWRVYLSLDCKMVQWRRSSTEIYKYNFDGVYKENSGHSSLIFCMRNCIWRLIYAEVKILSDGTNLIAEVKGLKVGLEYYISNNFSLVVMETNLLMLKKVLDEIWEVHWSITMDMKDINNMKNLGNITKQYVYKEGS